jgi:hypothetical protein
MEDTSAINGPDIHTILAQAATTYKNNEFVPRSFKVDQQVISIVDDICRQHGISVSAFLRECCNELVRGYFPNRQ